MEGRGKGLKRVLLPPKALKTKSRLVKKKLVTETLSFLAFLFICNMCE